MSNYRPSNVISFIYLNPTRFPYPIFFTLKTRYFPPTQGNPFTTTLNVPKFI